MPLFEFKCQNCGNVFEELVTSRDEHPPCPSCTSTETDKQLASFSVGSSASSCAPMGCSRPGCGSGFS